MERDRLSECRCWLCLAGKGPGCSWTLQCTEQPLPERMIWPQGSRCPAPQILGQEVLEQVSISVPSLGQRCPRRSPGKDGRSVLTLFQRLQSMAVGSAAFGPVARQCPVLGPCHLMASWRQKQTRRAWPQHLLHGLRPQPRDLTSSR